MERVNITNQEFDFRAYFLSLTEKQREEFGRKAGRSAYYIRTHLIHGYKMPRNSTIQGLTVAGNGAFTKEQLILWFHRNCKH